jgi:hypothetical protein
MAMLVIYFAPLAGYPQAGFKKGIIVKVNNDKFEDSLRFSKGKLMARVNGKTKTYTPGEIKKFSLGNINYVSYLNDFYKEVATGNNACLYQKVSDNRDQAIYNGIEAIGFLKTTEGKVGDFYVLRNGDTKFDLVTRKNFKDYFIGLFIANDSLITKIRGGDPGYNKIKEAVALYNDN